jgi:hypothetical protein
MKLNPIRARRKTSAWTPTLIGSPDVVEPAEWTSVRLEVESGRVPLNSSEPFSFDRRNVASGVRHLTSAGSHSFLIFAVHVSFLTTHLPPNTAYAQLPFGGVAVLERPA